MSLSHVTCSKRLPLIRSKGLNQAKPGRASVKTHSFPAFSVLLVLSLPPPCYFFRVTGVTGVQKGSVALRVTW